MGVGRPIVVVISADPRASHRAGEAARIGLGLAASARPVTLVLAGEGLHLLDADTEELVDGDTVLKLRENLKKLGVPFHVDRRVLPAGDWNREGHPVVPLSGREFAALVDAGGQVIVF